MFARISNLIKKIKTSVVLLMKRLFCVLKHKFSIDIFLIIITASLTAYSTYLVELRFEQKKSQENTKKVQQIVNAELIENLDIANKYQQAKDQIVNDKEFVSFLQDHRFYVDSLKELMANNFQYLSQNDLYHLAIIRDKMNILNRKFDKVEKDTFRSRISSNSACNFLYFLPERKYWAHRFFSDDLNRMFYSMKQLSFFVGNPFPDLNEDFEITDAKISVGYFKYSDEYKEVNVDCN